MIVKSEELLRALLARKPGEALLIVGKEKDSEGPKADLEILSRLLEGEALLSMTRGRG
jgi:hypothetical protein